LIAGKIIFNSWKTHINFLQVFLLSKIFEGIFNLNFSIIICTLKIALAQIYPVWLNKEKIERFFLIDYINWKHKF